MKTITVKLTVEQWEALHSCAVGELESLTDSDWASGVFDDLEAARAAMVKAREKAAGR